MGKGNAFVKLFQKLLLLALDCFGARKLDAHFDEEISEDAVALAKRIAEQIANEYTIFQK